MRSLPLGLAQKLDKGVTTIACAWRLTRRDNVIVAITQHDRDLTFDGTTFIAAEGLVGSGHDKALNLTPDRTALSGAMSVSAISETDLALGRWDRAKVEMFLVDWSNPVDFIVMWSGLVAGASWRGKTFELDVVGPQSVLNREIGRVYSRSCDAALGDEGCKVDLGLAGRTLMTSIIGVLSDRVLSIATPAGKTPSDFEGGILIFQSGPLVSWRCDVTSIKLSAGNWVINVSRPLPVTPTIGDAFKISMGCDKVFATCKARFANGLNFRGQPTLPGDDVAFGGPSVGGNDGGKR